MQEMNFGVTVCFPLKKLCVCLTSFNLSFINRYMFVFNIEIGDFDILLKFHIFEGVHNFDNLEKQS